MELRIFQEPQKTQTARAGIQVNNFHSKTRPRPAGGRSARTQSPLAFWSETLG